MKLILMLSVFGFCALSQAGFETPKEVRKMSVNFTLDEETVNRCLKGLDTALAQMQGELSCKVPMKDSPYNEVTFYSYDDTYISERYIAGAPLIGAVDQTPKVTVSVDLKNLSIDIVIIGSYYHEDEKEKFSAEQWAQMKKALVKALVGQTGTVNYSEHY